MGIKKRVVMISTGRRAAGSLSRVLHDPARRLARLMKTSQRRLMFAKAKAAAAHDHDLDRPSWLSPAWPYTVPSRVMGFSEVADPAHLYQRVRKRQVDLREARGASFGNKSLLLKLLNCTERNLKVDIPMGSTFLSQAAYEQSLITQAPVQLELSPSEQRDLALDAYCGVASF